MSVFDGITPGFNTGAVSVLKTMLHARHLLLGCLLCLLGLLLVALAILPATTHNSQSSAYGRALAGIICDNFTDNRPSGRAASRAD